MNRDSTRIHDERRVASAATGARAAPAAARQPGLRLRLRRLTQRKADLHRGIRPRSA